MKYNNIIKVFCVILPISILLRVIQMVYTVEDVTGFFKRGYAGMGFALLVAILIAFAAVFITSYTARRCPKNPPKVNLITGLFSLALGVSMAYQLFTEEFVSNVRSWQIVMLDITGALAAIYFIAFGFKMIVNYKLPKLFSLIPAVYWIFRLICIFTSISELALIVENIITLASNCLILLFMVSMAKLYNGIDNEKNFKKLLSFGLCCAMACFTDALPRIIALLSGHAEYMHGTLPAAFTVLMCGCFAASFTFSHFSSSNLRTKKHLKSGRTSASYYTD